MSDNNRKEVTTNQSIGTELIDLIKSNIREYAMYIALVLIFIYFGVKTNGLFLSSRNLSDLINQTGYVAVLAIGMTVILIIKHIDLSVGYVAGFLGAVAAIYLRNGLNVWLVILLTLFFGVVIGVYHGTLIAGIGVPAFVTTLAGMFIFRGFLMRVTAGTGTIIVNDKTFRDISNGYIPDIPGLNIGFHNLTVIIGILSVLLFIISQIHQRNSMQKYNFKVMSLPVFIFKILIISAVIIAIMWILAGYKGIPWTAIIVGLVLFIFNFVLHKTRLGRYIYGIGGNAEAAELSGVNVRNVTLVSFAAVSMMAALSGIMYTSRLSSATPTAGLGFELDAIASSYIGGVSVNGGIGRVTNTIIGALVIMSLTNGMNLMYVDVSYQYVVRGAIFILAVAFDVKTRGKSK